MTHIETKDPFGFVGSHVVRRGARKHGEEHGWLTRYDDALDCYTLFVPGGGEPRLLPRGEVMKFLSAPNVELHSDDQDAFPPPVKDETTSRYLGVSLRRPRDESIAAENKVQEDLRGRVTCFLPFADKYQVEYEDGTTEHLTEAAVIDGMIALIKSPFFSSPSRRKTRTSPRRTRKTVESSEDEELAPNGRRKRRRVEEEAQASAEQIPTTSVAVVENGEHEEQKEDGDEVVEFNDGTETQPAPNILEVMNSVAGEIRPNSLEHASAPMEEPVQVDGGDVSEPDAAEKILESAQPTETTDNTQPIVNPIPVEPIDPMKKKIIPSYIIEKKPHEATEPLPKRAMAFELLRATLLNLLDRQEANKVKIPLQYDLLRNTDVRDRDAVLRFMKADGLIVLNHLLNNYAVDVLANDDEESNKEDASTSIEQVRERMKRDDELLFVLKVLAMMPVPEREQVLQTKIGITIGHLCKTNGPPGRQCALPKCIRALAKWIKATWLRSMPKESTSAPTTGTRQTATRSLSQGRRGGHSGKTGRPSYQLNRRQPPPSQRLQRQDSSAPTVPSAETEDRVVDNTPIPRITRAQVTPPADPPVVSPAPASTPAPASAFSAPRRVTGGLKPDWMRQKENLSRSRFCIDDNTSVDTSLYRDNRTRPITNVPVILSSQAHSAPDKNAEQPEDAGGPDGVYGRTQRLRFGKRWSQQEFMINDPPGLLTQGLAPSYSMPAYARSQYPTHYQQYVSPVRTSRRTPARSILRRVSRYNDEPAIEGAGR